MFPLWFLGVVIAVALVVIIAFVFYMMVMYSSPDDKNDAYFARGVVVLSLSLACLIVLLLPLDVANRLDPSDFPQFAGRADEPAPQINTAVMWQVLLLVAVVLCVAVIPFSIFYYEAGDAENPTIKQRVLPAFLYTLASVFVFTVVVIIVYFSTGRKIDIPYTAYTYDLSQLPAGGGAFPPPADANFTTEWADGVAGNVRVGLSFAIFCVAIISALGWLLLIIFGGAGLPGVPVDFVNAWRNRPQPIGTKVYSEEKAALARISGQLIDAGEALEVEQRKAGGKPGRALRARLNAFKLDAHAVAAKHKALEVAYRQGGISPFLAVGYVVAAVVTALLSLAWVVHIVAANLLGYCVAESGAPSFSVSLACPPDRFVPGVAPVLSAVFKALSDAFALLGLVAYGLFAFYLLLCVVKGCVRVGTRFLLFSVHPLEPGATLMNSFLFNALLLLLAATAVAQFAAQSFRTYAANTAADVMFTAFVMAIPGIKYIYVYAQYAMLGIALITMVIMLACRPAPRDTAYKPIASG